MRLTGRSNKKTTTTTSHFFSSPRLGTANAKTKDPYVENPELKVLLLTRGVGQNIAMHASPTARDFFIELISTFPVRVKCPQNISSLDNMTCVIVLRCVVVIFSLNVSTASCCEKELCGLKA